MKYPGRIIKVGEQDAVIVKALKLRLNKVLGSDPALRLDPDDPNYGPKMKQMVKLFQARNVDAAGRPLKQDGEVGSLTWASLFGDGTVPASDTADGDLLGRVVQVAAGEDAKHVREVPKNSNRGPQVDAYLKRAGVPTGLSWCCAFVYWCFDEAAKALDCDNPMVKTAGCLDHWQRATSHGATRIGRSQAVGNPELVKPGMVFIMDHGGGLGHTGLVEKVAGGLLTTIEGNTDASKTREGGGVYRLTRKITEINKGFIDYSGEGK
ncbi:peptidoglycan-binding domain protein, putative [Geotalea daltonii FRC-32]|uniref:Peptidoglycan-binding domain protein, putative n=1 Tax=Geotalea daltonii (strain DSM 22248 / JCM 15807 / FRC-32) TaxID=316067 RepID=B9M482_GEODF|nr:CHAP domain-containing protein [Geotalea daltonii]ACM21537.1 peptidoglycan-binding domain protein, putative [Geotalea daltonii FRC-32]